MWYICTESDILCATGLFLCSLKTSEKQKFSDVFRGYRKRPVAWNGLKIACTDLVILIKESLRQCSLLKIKQFNGMTWWEIRFWQII